MLHYLFIFSVLASVFGYLLFNRKSFWITQLLGSVIIILYSYFFVYERTIGMINVNVLACILPLMTGLFAIVVSTMKKVDYVQETKKGVGKWFALIGLVLGELFFLQIIYGFPWVKTSFSLDKADVVLFTLRTSESGAFEAVLYSYLQSVFAPSIKFLMGYWLVFGAGLFFIYLRNKSYLITMGKIKIFINRKNWCINFVFVNLFLAVFFLVLTLMSLSVLGKNMIDVFEAYTREREYIASDLYQKYYVSPDTVLIRFPDEKKNLIFIMLESMETNFARYTPELQNIKKNNLSFSPGGMSIATQEITIRSQVAKYCGVPLKFPSYDNYHVEVFLPNVTCIQDILNKNGYRQLFVQGTDKIFGSLQHFLNTHSQINIHDLNYYGASEICVGKQNSFLARFA